MPRTAHLLALTAALLSAGATIWIRHGLREAGAYAGFWVNVAVGTIALWTAVLVTGGPGRITATGLAFFVAAGLIGTVAGRLLRFVAIDKVGASVGAALINLNPLVSSVLAILLLGEHVTAPILAGTVLIVVGAIMLSAGPQRVGFRPWMLGLPLLSATCFGVVAILRKLGLSEMSPVTGTAVNVTTALVAFGAFLLAAGRRDAFVCRGRSLGYFVAAGLAENTAVFLNVMALGMGAVSVVAPLYASTPIFVLLLSFFFLRGLETLSRRLVIGTVLTVLGIALITALSGR